ncbi:MAG: ABC transporter permease [Crocinitomicaceae bacterium]|nr:ABC transporter permease [Crocinitomicaceae bacterium]
MSKKVSFLLARRYLFAWKKRNAINLITGISILGIAVSTAALVILISAFNGIEFMIDRMYSDFDTDLEITSVKTKTFEENQLNLSFISTQKEVNDYSRIVEEFVVLKNKKKWVNARVVGVDSSFLDISNINKHLITTANNKKKAPYFCFIGAGLLKKLNINRDEDGFWDKILCYAPKRDLKIRVGKNPFYIQEFHIQNAINFNKEVNEEVLLLPLEKARDLLGYKKELSSICIDLKKGVNATEIKEKIQKNIGSDFVVKTRVEKNELIFKTSKSEKIIVILILIFVFILSSFNLISSITIMFAEKSKNLKVLTGMGLSKKHVVSLFFYVGSLISAIGVLFGLLLGYGICFIQLSESVLLMPGTNEPFPIVLKFVDAVYIVSLVIFLTISFSFLTVRFLARRRFVNGMLKNNFFQ